ncbi:hypothetical protein G0U57_019054, partial [Chelydra serpentina]
ACRVRADSALPRPRCHQKEQAGAALPPPALALSTARLCQAPHHCQPCVRVRLALHTAGLGSICRLQLDFLVLGTNRASWLQVWRRHPEAAGALVSQPGPRPALLAHSQLQSLLLQGAGLGWHRAI